MQVKLKFTEEEIKEALLEYVRNNAGDVLLEDDNDEDGLPPHINFLVKSSSGLSLPADADTVSAELTYAVEVAADHPYR
jgi:hypothetical protein